MKKYGYLAALWVAVIVGLYQVAHAATQTCQRTDFFCYESGPTGNLLTPARLDSSGNLTLFGSETVSGQSIYPPISQVNISTIVPVSVTGSFMVVDSTGSMVPFSTSVAIATSTAINGQFFILSSTSSVSTLQITTGTATGVIGDDAVIVISSTKSAVGFIYSSPLSQWIEVGRQ